MRIISITTLLALTACDSPLTYDTTPDDVEPVAWEHDVLRPAPVTFDAGLVQNCLIADAGTIQCWGDEASDVEWGTVSDAPQGDGWEVIEADHWLTCALRMGDVTCWGRREITNALVLEVEEQPPMIDFALGTAGGISINLDGSLNAWGSNIWGQASEHPRGGNFIDVEAGYGWACAVEDTGQLHCWGIEDGEGTYYVAHNHVDDAPYGERFQSIRRGTGDVLCGLDVEGFTHCWGSDQYGESSDITGEPLAVVTASDTFACGLDHQGAVVCGGVLGGTPAPATDDWNNIACGYQHCCVVTDDMDTACWGVDTEGAMDPWGLPDPME